MTLIIAAHVQDHLILAGDHCAVLSRVSNEGPPDAVLDNYRKLYPWKYGAIANSGDVFLMTYFCRMFQHHESKGQPINLLQVARDAKAARSSKGICPSKSVGNLFFTLPGGKGFGLFFLSVEKDKIDCEIVEPVSARFSMSVKSASADESACSDLVKCLLPSFFFQSIDDFHQHHIDLLKQFFLQHSSLDELVTASFDVYMMDKRTGVGTFWHVSEPPKQLAFVHLSNEEGDVGDAAFVAYTLDASGFDGLIEDPIQASSKTGG